MFTNAELQRLERCMRIYGCAEAEVLGLNEGRGLGERGSLSARYQEQRRAAKTRGIPWEITFPEWVGLWVASGHLQRRGVGRAGYCMARHGDEGAYRLDNVSIKPNGANSREGAKKSWDAGLLDSHNRAAGRGWTYRPGFRNPYQVMVSNKYVGVYPTEELAQAAYMKAWGDLGAIPTQQVSESTKSGGVCVFHVANFFAPQ